MYISFAWTTPALLARAKSATRRMWAPSHAAKFRAGQIVDAYDRSPRLGGRRVATIRIARDPWKQRTGLMDDVVDYEREGILDEVGDLLDAYDVDRSPRDEPVIGPAPTEATT